jgi:hypothetical protein
MSEVIISNNIEDYKNCIGEILRNKSGFKIGVIAEVINYHSIAWNTNRIVLVLEDGRKVYADKTKFAKAFKTVSNDMVTSRKYDGNSLLWSSGHFTESDNEEKVWPSIGKSIYRDGQYVGVITSVKYDDFGAYYSVSNGSKIRIEFQEEDEFIDPLLFENGDDY